MKYLLPSLCSLLLACATATRELPPSSLRAVESAPPASLASAPASQGAALRPPATRSAGRSCAQIEAVLTAEIYRGTPPKSQSQLEAEKAYTGKVYERDDHFMRYLKCEYQVTINGARYSYSDYLSGVTIQDSLETSMCEGRRAEVEQALDDSTQGCTELRRGEFYGTILVPFK